MLQLCCFFFLSEDDHEDEGLEVEEEEEAVLREGDEVEEVLFDAVDEEVRSFLRAKSRGVPAVRVGYVSLFLYVGVPV